MGADPITVSDGPVTLESPVLQGVPSRTEPQHDTTETRSSMMTLSKSTVRTTLAGMAAGACVAAGALIGTGQAGALTVDEYSSVRQVLCTDSGLPVDVSYINAYGNTTRWR